jgi:glucan-binding YG repeat protein
MAGKAVIDESLYIDGKWYYFDEDGIMLSNRFVSASYYKFDGFAYYTSSGARAEYTGWKFINNNWVYFNDSSFVKVGWVLDGGKYYYQDVSGAIKNPTLKMITGYKVIDEQLYYFNGGGVLTKTITSYGWHQVGSDWYFVGADGKVVTDEAEHLIDGAYYAFDYDGIMVSNDIWNGKYYNAGGVLVTNPGWYIVDGKWIYVTKTGDVAGYGVYLIGGKEYYFCDYYWVA